MITISVSFGWITKDLLDLPALNVVGEFARDYPANLQFTQRALLRPIVEAATGVSHQCAPYSGQHLQDGERRSRGNRSELECKRLPPTDGGGVKFGD